MLTALCAVACLARLGRPYSGGAWRIWALVPLVRSDLAVLPWEGHAVSLGFRLVPCEVRVSDGVTSGFLFSSKKTKNTSPFTSFGIGLTPPCLVIN